MNFDSCLYGPAQFVVAKDHVIGYNRRTLQFHNIFKVYHTCNISVVCVRMFHRRKWVGELRRLDIWIRNENADITWCDVTVNFIQYTPWCVPCWDPPEIRHKSSFAHNSQYIWKVSHYSVTPVLCVKFQNDSLSMSSTIDEWICKRQIKMPRFY